MKKSFLSAALFLFLVHAVPAGDKPTPVIPLDLLENEPSKSAVAPRGNAPVEQAIPQIILDRTQAQLEQIRLTRTRAYSESAGDRSVIQRVLPVGGGPLMPAVLDSGMTLRFRLIPPQGWTIISVEEASLVSVLDQRGVPLDLAAGGRVPSRRADPGFAVVSAADDLAEAPTLELHAALPPRADEGLAKVAAQFRVTTGQRVRHRVANIRNLVGRGLALPEGDPKFDLVIEEVGEDAVVIRAVGDVDWIGALHFANAGGEALDPYLSDAGVDRRDGRIQKTWRFGFFELPGVIRLLIDHFTAIREESVVFEREEIQLP